MATHHKNIKNNTHDNLLQHNEHEKRNINKHTRKQKQNHTTHTKKYQNQNTKTIQTYHNKIADGPLDNNTETSPEHQRVIIRGSKTVETNYKPPANKKQTNQQRKH